MKIAIVDDFASDRKYLKDMLCSYFNNNRIVFEIVSYDSGESFLNEFQAGSFTAVFLDNLMGGINGIETAKRIRISDTSIAIIFVTTEESYALEGYIVQAFDYVIKPVTAERLHSVLERLYSQFKPEKFIEVKENRIDRRILLRQILYVRSSGHFLEICTKNETCRCYMSLDALIFLLKEAGEYGNPEQGLQFQGCCRGYVVNLEEVLAIESQDFLLSNGLRIPISRSKYKEMQTAYASYLFSKTRRML